MAEKKTILVVDDDFDIREQLEMQLKANGYDVILAEGEMEANDMIKEEDFDLAIVDLMMEHNDSGFNLSYRIKKKDKSIPVILLTAVTSETGMEFNAATEEDRSWIKADILLNKPIRPEQLKKEITRLLKG